MNNKFLSWLIVFRAACKHIPIKQARKIFVTELHNSGNMWHFDDDAFDCNFKPEEAKLLNEIRDILYDEELFELALEMDK